MSLALGLCVALGAGDAAASAGGDAAPPQAQVFIAATRFTLAWTHSIERVRWEEDYAVRAEDGAAAPQLLAVAARVRGSAAGMEPGPEAVLREGWYHFRPAQGVLAELWLTRSTYSADYLLCLMDAPCRPLAAWLPSDGWRTRLWPCRGGGRGG